MFSQFRDWPGDVGNQPAVGCIGDRGYAAECLKRRLDDLRELEKRIEAARHEFAQLAIASRLKSEFDPSNNNLCESERRPPVECRARWRQLTNGRLLVLELANRLPSTALTDWIVLIQIAPLVPLELSAAGRRHRRGGLSQTRTYAHYLSRLDAGSIVAMEFYCGGGGGIEQNDCCMTKPILVRCYLARHFGGEPAAETTARSRTVLSFCVSASVLAANDLVYGPSAASFLLGSGGSARSSHTRGGNDNLVDSRYFKFCVTRSLLGLIFRDKTESGYQFMQWLFPQVDRREWSPPQSHAGTAGIDKSSCFVQRSPVLTLSASATVKCTIQERVETEDYLITIELTAVSYELPLLFKNLKVAIWIKLLLAVSQFRKYQASILLDRAVVMSGGGKIKATDDVELSDYIAVKFPFA